MFGWKGEKPEGSLADSRLNLRRKSVKLDVPPRRRRDSSPEKKKVNARMSIPRKWPKLLTSGKPGGNRGGSGKLAKAGPRSLTPTNREKKGLPWLRKKKKGTWLAAGEPKRLGGSRKKGGEGRIRRSKFYSGGRTQENTLSLPNRAPKR